MEVQIRKAILTDVPEIKILWEELMDYHAAIDPYFIRRSDGANNFAQFIAEQIEKTKIALVVVAEYNKILVGFSHTSFCMYPPIFAKASFVDLMDMVVHPDYRRQGIGAKIFAMIKEWATSLGVDRIELRAALRNEASNPFWQTLGFQPYLTHYCIDIKP